MQNTTLPIDVVAGSNPPRFIWNQLVETINGKQVVAHEGGLPPSVEVAVQRLIGVAKDLLRDNAALQGQVEGMTQRAAQSELSGKRADKASPTVTAPKKNKAS